MIDSDLADSDLGTRGGVHLIERKKARRESERESRARRIERQGDSRGEGYPCSVSEDRLRQSKRQIGDFCGTIRNP